MKSNRIKLDNTEAFMIAFNLFETYNNDSQVKMDDKNKKEYRF